MPRRLVGELMDDPAIDPAAHDAALRGLARLNRMSRSAAMLWPHVRREAAALDRPLRLLDVATGSGDVPIALALRSRQAGLEVECSACDVSEHALRRARERADAAGIELRTMPLDLLREPLPDTDVAVCSLFLHHLTNEEAERVLRSMCDAAGRLVLANDLRRGAWGTALAATVPRIATRSPVVHVDALRSARAAFSLAEARDLVRGIAGRWSVAPRFPGRMLLAWSPTP
ncbi:MAG: methyltransferase domain-containing protein [Planctomycetota bacterium]